MMANNLFSSPAVRVRQLQKQTRRIAATRRYAEAVSRFSDSELRSLTDGEASPELLEQFEAATGEAWRELFFTSTPEERRAWKDGNITAIVEVLEARSHE